MPCFLRGLNGISGGFAAAPEAGVGNGRGVFQEVPGGLFAAEGPLCGGHPTSAVGYVRALGLLRAGRGRWTQRERRGQRGGDSCSSTLIALADLFVEFSTTQLDVGWSSTNRPRESNLFGERSHLRRHSYFGAGTVPVAVPANRVKIERTEPRGKLLLAVELAERAAQDIGDLAYGARCSGTVDDRCG